MAMDSTEKLINERMIRMMDSEQRESTNAVLIRLQTVSFPPA